MAGPQPFLLLMRADPQAAAEMARRATGDPGAGSEAEGALRELCRRLALRLAVERGMEPTPIQPRLAPCSLQAWPAGPPQSLCILHLPGGSVEARLWSLPSLP
jgi:hypothetical protein